MAGSEFYIALSDSTGAKRSGTETLLVPGPSVVEYPTDPLGSRVETADGILIVQQPSKDNRVRSWIWHKYPKWMPAYQVLFDTLHGLRSRRRLAYGASPYIYVKDNTTQLLWREYLDSGTATSNSGTNTLIDTGKTFTSALVGHVVEIMSGTGVGQFRTVLSTATNTLTMTTNWSVNPQTGATYVIRGRVNDYFKARVIEVSESVQEGGDVLLDSLKFSFVIEDTNFNAIG